MKEEENEKKSNNSSKKELTDDEFDNKLDKAIENKFDKGGQKINPMDVALAYNTDHPEPPVTINNEVDEDDDWDPATADLDNIDPDKLSKKQVEKMLVYLNSLDADDAEDEETDEGVDDIDEFNKSVEESMRQHVESENESDDEDSEDDDLDEESEDDEDDSDDEELDEEDYEEYVPDPDDPSLVGFDPATIDYSRCRPSDFTPAQLWVIEQYMMQSEDEPEEDEE